MDALREGRVSRGAPGTPLRDVRLNTVVRGVRLLPGGGGVEVAVEGQVGAPMAGQGWAGRL